MKLILFLSFIFNAIIAIPQEKSEISNVMILSKKDKPKKECYFKEGKRIKCFLKNDDVKICGRFKIASDSTIILDGKEIILSKIRKIRGNPNGISILEITSAFTAGFGILGVFGGFGMIHQYRNDSSCVAPFYKTWGWVFVSAGAAAIFIGSVPLIIADREFDLERKWDLKISEKSKKQRLRKT